MLATLQKYGYNLDVQSSSIELSSPTSELEGSPTALQSPSLSSSSSVLQLTERKNQQSAFHLAAKKGHIDVLRALAKIPQADEYVSRGDRHGNTPLHFAVGVTTQNTKEIALEAIDCLLSIGANIGATNLRGQTPLSVHIMTAKIDDPTITRMFLSYSQQSSPKSKSNSTSPTSAYKVMFTPTLQVNDLVQGKTYLHMAIEKNFLEIASALVAGGASINIPDDRGVMVSDTIPKKVLMRLINCMKEGTQTMPSSHRHTIVACKLCQCPKSLLDPLKECGICGRPVCKNCVTKPPATSIKEQDNRRLCNTCCTVVLLQEKRTKAKLDFNQRLYGCGMK